jgi:fatty-acyl-CoA synthase
MGTIRVGRHHPSAFVRPAVGGKVNKDELFAFVGEHVAPHKTPKHWFAVEQFP